MNAEFCFESLPIEATSEYEDGVRRVEKIIKSSSEKINLTVRPGFLRAHWKSPENGTADAKCWVLCTKLDSMNSLSCMDLRMSSGPTIEPRSYLTRVIERLPYCVTVDDFEALLPA